MVYCKNCVQQVEGERKWNWPAFFALLFFGGIGVIYPFYVFFKTKSCPICHGTNWRKSQKDEENEGNSDPAWKKD